MAEGPGMKRTATATASPIVTTPARIRRVHASAGQERLPGDRGRPAAPEGRFDRDNDGIPDMNDAVRTSRACRRTIRE